MPSTVTQFPNLGAPVVDSGGLLTQEWRQFFSTIWARTGSALGSVQVATGVMLPFAGSVLPEGYLLCDGSAVSRAAFPGLFAKISTLWGAGDGVNTFNLPDASGRSLFGAGSGFALGSSGGSEELTLSVGQLPVHSHDVTDPGHTHGTTTGPHTHTVIDPGHVHTDEAVGLTATNTAATTVIGAGAAAGATGSATTGITLDPAIAATTIDPAFTGITLGDTGSGDDINILPPYLVIQWMIKI